jgi:hypothetical protein
VTGAALISFQLHLCYFIRFEEADRKKKIIHNGEAERVGKEEGGTISGGTICTTLDEVPTPLDTKKCV